ncbi:MAG: hypothetical protein K2P86_07525 [Xanthobacteraceae bacterium]|jgi:uncharacterized membrane protein YhaH (DUF805 family)|nr:hypothetical protein [Xanthobacteraceae bacterium]
MSYFDLLFSPKGTIKQPPFALIAIAIYAINIIAGSIVEGDFIKRAGPWPYLGMQAMLTWIWFAAHAKRLRDAGRGWAVAAVLAFIYIAAIVLMLNLVSASAANITEPADPKEPKVSLIGTIFAVLFINTLFTGDIFLISLLIFLFIGLPLLFSLVVVIYSIVTAARASVTPDTAQPQQLPSA